MDQIIFDFFNDTHAEWFKSFCDYFKLNKIMVGSYFDSINPDTLTPGKIARDLDLNLNDYNGDRLSIVCRHMTTATKSDIDGFSTNGVLNLKRMLQEKTPLSTFLESYDIKVDVDNRKICINRQSFPITSYGESCTFCFKGREIPCNEYFKCDPRKDMEHYELNRKLRLASISSNFPKGDKCMPNHWI